MRGSCQNCLFPSSVFIAGIPEKGAKCFSPAIWFLVSCIFISGTDSWSMQQMHMLGVSAGLGSFEANNLKHEVLAELKRI